LLTQSQLFDLGLCNSELTIDSSLKKLQSLLALRASQEKQLGQKQGEQSSFVNRYRIIKEAGKGAFGSVY